MGAATGEESADAAAIGADGLPASSLKGAAASTLCEDSLITGASVAVYGERVTPDAVLSFFRAVKPTIFLSVPTFYRSMLAVPGFAAQLRDMNFRFMI